MDVKRMIAILQIYIHLRKGIEVDINIRNMRDIILLKNAYDTAIGWMTENDVEINSLR